ncbi:MAG: GntR family transcriptional regulator [Paracoccaceae bacterium]
MSDAARRRKGELASYLRQAVMTLELRPGVDIDEAALSDRFEISRTPLREVLRQLAGEGYVDLRENRGARVSEMSHTTLRDFFLAAPMVYGAILKLAALNARVEQIEALKQAQEQFRQALRSSDVVGRALTNNHFHEITGEMADNIYLLPSFRRLLIDHARISMTFYQPRDQKMAENLSEASTQHEAIIAAIEDRDEAEAGRLAIEHWNLSRDQIELFVMPAGLDFPLGALARKTPA